MIEFSKEVRESKEMNEICKRVLDSLDKPKGRPRKENKNIRFSCTLTPAQLDWLNKTADEMGIERSAVLRNCVDRIIEEDTLCYLCKSTVEENNKIQFGKPICNECYKIYKKHGTAHLR